MTNSNLLKYKDTVQLSSLVYRDGLSSNSPIPSEFDLSNYTIVATSEELMPDDNSGYFGIAVRNNSNGKITIVSRGTQPTSIKDLYADIQLGLDIIPTQAESGIYFTERVAVFINGREEEFHQTGHSLGGAIAQLSALRFGSTADAYNAPGVNGLVNDIERDYGVTIDRNSFVDRINNVNATGDRISDVDKQIGNIEEIEVDNSSWSIILGLVFGVATSNPVVGIVVADVHFRVEEHESGLLSNTILKQVMLDGIQLDIDQSFLGQYDFLNQSITLQFQDNTELEYLVKPKSSIDHIINNYNITLEDLELIPENLDLLSRVIEDYVLIKPEEALKLPENSVDSLLMYSQTSEGEVQFNSEGNPTLNSPIDLYIQSITQSTQDPSLSGQEWLTGTQDYFLNWIEGYSDLTLDSFLTTTSDLLANNNDSNISNYYQNNSSNAYDDVFNNLLNNHNHSSANNIQNALDNLGINYQLNFNDQNSSLWDTDYNDILNQSTVNDIFFFNEDTNFTLGFDNISGGYYGTGNNDNGLEDFSINLDYKAPINFFGSSQNHISPLTFDLDGDGIELSYAYDQNVYFDIDNDGFAEKVGWVNADDGQLAMDNNNNGNIDNITELYGDDQMPAFEKLRQHDSNNDGVINNQDTDFDKFLVWRDLNQNGISEEGELKTLTETGIKEISLAETKIADDDPIRWNNENFISATSRFTWDDAHGGNDGILADVHFLNDNVDTWYKGAQYRAQIRSSKY